MDAIIDPPLHEDASSSSIETGTTFLRALFDESDTILFRPIETWTEGGKKKSRVDYRKTCYRKAVPALLRITLQQLLKLSAEENLNLFFGVCPRLGDKGRFDLAWQIRTVRALWTDIDNVTVEEARERITKAGLPQPSIVVNSGNGVHLYWLLDVPYLIDDAGDPPAVNTEWTQLPDGRKKPRKYITEPQSNERLYLDLPANVPDLSPKAIWLQDVLAGIATAIGGDHTHDVARLLRLPGTLNRKDQRNGKPPVPSQLIACDPDIRYALDVFSRFAEASPARTLRQQIAAIQLPTQKAITPSRRDKLNELVAACATAPLGIRSESDWRLVCTAIEKGWPKEEVQMAVAAAGKFAEAGDRYFERTWSKAEIQVRGQLYQKATNTHDRMKRHKRSHGAAEANGDSEIEIGDEGMVAGLAAVICNDNWFAQDVGGKLYLYRSGVYQPRGETFVKAQVKRLCGATGRLDEWSSHLANEIVEFIRVDSPALWERPSDHVVNVKNGLLDVRSKTLRAHTHDHLSSVQLPIEYDPAATCPEIDRFITEVFPEDAIDLAYEIPAWLMLPNTSIQKAILLIGTGGNGKSRYLQMVNAFLGRSNVVNLSLHRLESDRFSTARLYGKLANICPDLPSEHLAGTSVFKTITGGDPLPGEYKFKDSFEFVPFCRLVFSANSPPRAEDSSEGFFDRWLVVPFERRFRSEQGEIPSATLDAMLSQPNEQSGLLNRALEAAERLASCGRFTTAASLSRAFDEFHATTDPLSVWLDTYTLEDPRMFVPKGDLIVAFARHCEARGKNILSGKAFGAALKKKRPQVEDGQRTVQGKVQWCYLGIGLKGSEPVQGDVFGSLD